MNTSKYDAQKRRDIKDVQRSSIYRDSQQRAAAARSQLEIKLRERNEVIARLKTKISVLAGRLVEAGLATEEVAKLMT